MVNRKVFTEVNTAGIDKKLELLSMSNKDNKKAVKAALRKSGNVIKTSVKKGAATVTSNREKRNKGVNMSVYKDASGLQVNIMKPWYMSQGRGRRIFRLFWLECGTSEVVGRDGRKHGATPAKPFFLQAERAARPQAERQLSENILAQIDKIAKKRTATL